MRRRLCVLAGLVVGGALLAGCAGSGGSGSATYSGGDKTAPPAPNLVGTLQQYREDEVTHSLKVELRNAGATTVRVSSLAVAWSGLAGTDPAQVDYDIPPGATVALKVPYGDAVCTGSTRPTDPVEAEIVTPDSQLTIGLAASDVLLEKLWDQDCARQRLLDAVDVAFGDSWAPTTVDGAPVLRGTLVLTRGSSTGPIDVVDLDGSVLLTLDATPPAGTPLLTMPASAATASLSIDVGSTLRCDGHSLGESKKTYVFDVGLDLGDGRVDLTLQPPDDAKKQMYDVLTKACGLA
ncbi:hypothetical protein [Longivirga aurantiaca]|uniref:LTD domain-containing protein n=1 Tax=Longivirga aurantiaca TaxID=1837743 RepID=A0ABW1T532_9ACTN